MIETMVPINFWQPLADADWHVVFELILSYVQVLAWPTVIFVCIALFRKPISDKISGLESAKGAGIEATFFQNAIQDPTVSDETRAEISKLWIQMSAARDEPEPRIATDELAKLAALRSGKHSPEVRRRMNKAELLDDFLKTMEALSGGKYHVSRLAEAVLSGGMVTMPDYSVRPENGLDEVPIFFDYVDDDDDSAIISRIPDSEALIIVNCLTPTLKEWAAQHPRSAVIDWSDSDRDANILKALRDFHVFDHG